MRVKLEDVCERGSSNIKQSDIIKMSGNYPIYGASGLAGKVNFYLLPFVKPSMVKQGWSRNRQNNIESSKIFSDRNYAVSNTKEKCITRIFVLCCELYAFRKILHWSNHSTYLF